MNTPLSVKVTAASLTSFAALFGKDIQGHTIQEIVIPRIQRDYAQGRNTESVNRIRELFINALCTALLPNEPPIDLDFVFGDVEEREGEKQGQFYPLDGQQRLTTLFLLHCYLAWQIAIRPEEQPWRRFSYATRPGTRDFCEFIVLCTPDFSGVLSEWIKDHANYLPTWDHDPSIQSMLVVLDAIHGWFSAKQADCQMACAKLLNESNPAIRFHVLPMEANDRTDELYIKMNSRGKPLTSFETFKAHFEDVLHEAHPDKEKDFARNVDTHWSDILWPYRGEDHLIDSEFLRYFRYISEVCAWKSGYDFEENTHDDELVTGLYGLGAANATNNLLFLFQAWNVLRGKDIKHEFESILTHQPGGASTPLLMFNPFDKEGVDLFRACCQHYGTRQWTLAHTLLLYAVLLRFIHQVAEPDFLKRFRILRNLVEASTDEIRAGERNNMPKLLIEVEQIIVHGSLQQVSTFNQVQVRNEEDKAAMVRAMPTLAEVLHQLEDHPLIRGGLTAFDLEPTKFARRAEVFIALFDKSAYLYHVPWQRITGALLAEGNYSRQDRRWTGHLAANFGSPKTDEPWQVLFRGRKGETSHPVSGALTRLLDDCATGGTLQVVVESYLTSTNTRKDWRYYFVKYDTMREGGSGRYVMSPSGYQVCMLERRWMNSDYYDPYLFAAVQRGLVSTERIANPKWPRCFTGDERTPRKLVLKNSGLQIQCVDPGWQISDVPANAVQKASFDRVCATLGIGDNCLYLVPQQDGIDTDDRVELGATLLAELIRVEL